MNVPPLKLIAFEVTRTCKLKCRHCRGDSRDELYTGELSLDEIKKIFDNVAGFAKPIMIITGGEPLTRPDVFDITAYSSSLGFRTVLATCGHFLNDETVGKLIDTGVRRISVSLDGASAETHDNFRGVPGAFSGALKGLSVARKHGLDFQINSTITTLNIGELEALHQRAVSLGAVGFHPFLLVPMGRGSGLADNALSPEEYEKALVKIAESAQNSPIEIKPTCSPHYYRIIRQMNAAKKKEAGVSSGQSSSHVSSHRHGLTKGCLGGQGFVFLSHIGKVQICGFLEIEAGDLRASGYDLETIWNNSEFLGEIRDLDNYNGKCGVCEYRRVCGGCRARAFYENDDYIGVEPNCVYIPEGSK